MFVERADLQRLMDGLVEFFEHHGFRLELEKPVDVFERISFCQTQPVLVSGEWRMLRHPETTVQKGSMCTLRTPNQKVLRKWCMAVGRCEGALNVGVPVLQAWAQSMRRVGLKASLKFQRSVWHGTTRGYWYVGREAAVTAVEADTRVSFFKAFGITPEEQVALEGCYGMYEMGELGPVVDSEHCMLDKMPVPRNFATLTLAGRTC